MTLTADAGRTRTPYGEAANLYYGAGWHGVLPLPPGAKYPPPHGYTGAGGAWPSGADVWTWAEDTPTANVGLRLPPNVIGLDVDAYGEKKGAHTLAAALERYGPLPDTYRSTSRTDGRSGIYLYRVPPGLAWPGELGPGVELIQTRHRYAVAPPSVHPSGRQYRWAAPDGARLHPQQVPTLDALPALPDAWVQGLTGGRLAVDIAKASIEPGAYASWAGQDKHTGHPCGIVRVSLARACNDLNDASASRHDIAVRAAMHLARLSTEGHTGCGHALDTLRESFIRSVTSGTDARSTAAATAEWDRIYDGALAVIAADGQLVACDLPDPCAHPLAGIIAPADLHAPPRLDVTSPYSGGGGGTETPRPVVEGDDRAAEAAQIEQERQRIRIRRLARRLDYADEQAAQWPGYPPGHALRDLLNLDIPDPEWTVENLLPAGGNVVVVAAAKAGKTTTVNDVVRSLVDGQPVFGRYDVRFTGGTCHLWNYEVSSGMYRVWLRDVGIHNDDRVHVLNLRGHRVPLSVEQVKREAVDMLVATDTRVWVLDPFARALIGNALSENDNSEVSAFLDILDEIKETAGVEHLIIPTHASRMDTVPGAERSRGASRLEDWADVRWYLSRDSEGGRFFRASGRDVETEEEQLVMDPITRRLQLQPGERAEPAAREGKKKRDVSDGEIADKVISFIRDCPGVSIRGLRTGVAGPTGVRESRVDAAVRACASQGLVVVVEGPRSAHQHYLPEQMSNG